MKKICFVLLVFFTGCTYIGPGSKYSKSVIYGQEPKLNQTEKIVCAFSGCIKTATGIWGFSQQSGYGNTTGIVFSISGLRDIYLAVRKEK